MTLDTWAKKWNISQDAINDLRKVFGISEALQLVLDDLSEAAVMSKVRLEGSKKNYRLWRNNVGATYAKDGRLIRYGLANESGKMCDTIKSADLIGIRPILITENMVGNTIGQFISREIKHNNWRYMGTQREKAQLRWIELINGLGGNACFASGEGTL